MKTVIKYHENDFLTAYNQQMYLIKKELKELKDKASDAKMKAKEDMRLQKLKEDRDWFRKEAVKLDKMCKEHKKVMGKMKTTLEIIEEDRDFFQEQLFNTKKVNKHLNIELQKYRQNMPTENSYMSENPRQQYSFLKKII